MNGAGSLCPGSLDGSPCCPNRGSGKGGGFCDPFFQVDRMVQGEEAFGASTPLGKPSPFSHQGEHKVCGGD